MEEDFGKVSRSLIMQIFLVFGEDFDFLCCINCEVIQNFELESGMIRFIFQEDDFVCVVNNGLERISVEVGRLGRKCFINIREI